MIELEKSYDASKVEADIYQKWLNSGYFTPENLPDRPDLTAEQKRPYTIVLPPPNVTGNLHMGHAFEDTIQDILIRFRRMQGRRALWIPGTDHASIATESKVAKLLEKDGVRKSDLGRTEFVKKVEQFTAESHDVIINQLKQIGASLDWTREAYTLDDKRAEGVRVAFKTMYDDGLIYQGYRVINWDPKGQTVISDDEVVHQERDAQLYTFRYSKDFPIPIATTRPETKVGDTAVAVNPNDPRYQQYIGKEYDMTFCGVPIHIKIIADEAVEIDFGTGALGVTPAHSIIDFEMSQRHNLPLVQVINEHAKMMVGGENLVNKKTTEARLVIVEWLQQQDLLEKTEDIKQSVGTAERTGAVIEPLPKLQWFIAVNKPFAMKQSHIPGINTGDQVTLKQLMQHVIEQKTIGIVPARFEKTYFNWINNLRDWCISRQLWFGHRIPVWYRANNTGIDGGSEREIYCDITPPEGEGWEQDPDTLDTWFSSGLWTFSTLGWPENTSDLQTYHPTSAIIPGYEILFFWVARMILMSTYLLGDIPFKNIYLHGIVRDNRGRKFSKSLNNGVDPLEVTEKFGTDALRMALVFGAAPGNDTAFDEQKVKGMKHFGNKLWNVARFILMNVDMKNVGLKESDEFSPEDEFVLKDLGLYRTRYDEARVVEKVTADLENFMLHEAAQTLYNSLWYEFADKYIEHSKPALNGDDDNNKRIKQTILYQSLVTYLKLLHPFMPFETEEIWSKLTQKDLLIVEPWPQQ